MPTKMKFYAVSVLAMRISDDLIDTTKQLNYWEHSPLILPSPSIDAVISHLKILVFNNWKKEDGWSKHSASITPIDKEFVFSYLALIQDGVMEFDSDSPEDATLVILDGEDPLADIQDGTSGHDN